MCTHCRLHHLAPNLNGPRAHGDVTGSCHPCPVLLGGSPSAVAHHPPAGTPASVGCSPCPITLWHTCGTPLTVHSVPESEAEPCYPPDPRCRQTPDPAPPRESEMNPKRNLFRAPGTWGMLEMWTAPRGVGWLARGGDAPHHPAWTGTSCSPGHLSPSSPTIINTSRPLRVRFGNPFSRPCARKCPGGVSETPTGFSLYVEEDWGTRSVMAACVRQSYSMLIVGVRSSLLVVCFAGCLWSEPLMRPRCGLRWLGSWRRVLMPVFKDRRRTQESSRCVLLPRHRAMLKRSGFLAHGQARRSYRIGEPARPGDVCRRPAQVLK